MTIETLIDFDNREIIRLELQIKLHKEGLLNRPLADIESDLAYQHAELKWHLIRKGEIDFQKTKSPCA